MPKRMSARDHERQAEQRGRVAVGRPKYIEDVGGGLSRLQGKSRSDLADDKTRGHMSPLSGRAHKQRKGKR
jgi:hypothetical protein